MAATSPRRSGGLIWKVFTVILALMLLFSLAGHFLTAIFSAPSAGPLYAGPNFEEVVLEDAGSRNKIALINVAGIISSSPVDPSGYTMVNYIEDQLDLAARDSQVRAVLMKVDSPGGEVLASDEIYHRILDFQKETGKPVVASMGSLAASGGYYVSAPCQWIVANDLTITGSIGVIMAGYNWRELMDKVGVTPQVFKSGEFKDMLSPDKRPSEITEEEKQLVQGMVDETFERFKEVVREGRSLAETRNEGEGRSLAENWEEYADGRIFSGSEAHRLGFVDELGNFETAFERAKELVDVSSANLIQYRQPFRLGSLLRLFGQAEQRTIRVDVGLDVPRLETGRLYFLSPIHIP